MNKGNDDSTAIALERRYDLTSQNLPDHRARFVVGIVRSMWDEVQTRDDLMKRIREDKFHSEEERKEALGFAERYPEKK